MTTPPPQGQNPFAPQGQPPYGGQQPYGQPQGQGQGQAPYPPMVGYPEQGPYPQQPGQPGFPPQGTAPYAPFPPQPNRKLSPKAIRIIVVIVIAIIGAFASYITSRDDADTAKVGDCMHRGSTDDSNPDLEVVDCSSSKAQYVVLAKVKGSYTTEIAASAKCEVAAKDFKYTYTESSDSSDFLLCLKDYTK
ncbi:hypothetical protein GCM10022403_031390 [Streptomyces coacervatus]|uniref:Uncharacterized protein n=1 Tax=Streptomyces coacervatus TaxID=647381 RepID=A0ABP7HK34_9ACTN|nr:hypothetical protein [Streptomyces coacervatus]MDF2271369.1 hypothetical protein [Streptomyces coacervatus]